MTPPPDRPDRPFGRRSVPDDVDDEIACHLEMHAQHLREAGLGEAEAREAARRRFGDLQQVRETCRDIGERWEREKRAASLWADLRQDARFALRAFRRAPAFVAVAVLTLALGIGASTAIFSVVNAVLLRPLPYADADRLVFLWATRDGEPHETLTPGLFLDFRARASGVVGLAAIAQKSLTLIGSGLPERLNGSSVSTDFFALLGVHPALGRTFLPEDSGAHLAILSDALWRRRFGADPSMVGRSLVLNEQLYRVIGVMPRAFSWPEVVSQGIGAVQPEIWVPPVTREVPGFAFDQPDLASNRTFGYLRAVGRLRRGVSMARAQATISAIATSLGREHPNEDGARGGLLVPLRTQLLGDVRRPLIVLAGAVALVLLIACANLANLLLGRASVRRQELAVRLALGASRGRLVRQLVTEALALAALAACAGTVLAAWGTRWLVSIGPTGVLRVNEARVDPPALLFAFGLAAITAVVFGLAPALRASRVDVEAALKGGGRALTTARGRRTRELLVVGEIALSLLLLVGAGLLLKSFVALRQVDLGFDPVNLLSFDLSLQGTRAEYQARQVAFYEEMLRTLGGLPGVRTAAGTVTLPIGGDDFQAPFLVEGRPAPPPGREPRSGYQIVSPRYFATMGIPRLRGRDFTMADDRRAASVIIVSRTLAKEQWPGEDAIGKHLRMQGSPPAAWMTVVGVVGDVRHNGPGTAPRAEFYQPYSQSSLPFLTAVVRTDADPLRWVPVIRRAMSRLDATLPLANVSTMEAHLRQSVAEPRFMSTLVGLFGGAALLLSAIGLYAVMAYLVTQRYRDIGIRVALGANGRDVLHLVLGRSLLLTGAGIALGLVAAFPATRVLAALLFGVTATDPATFVGVPLLLGLVAVLATLGPLRRALRIDPVVALRGE